MGSNLLSSDGVVQIGESEVGGCAAEPSRDGRDEAVAEGGRGGGCYEEFPVVCFRSHCVSFSGIEGRIPRDATGLLLV